MIISVLDHFNELAVSAGRTLLRNTVQLYHADNVNKPRPICSGILIKYRGARFLVSASHLREYCQPNEVVIFVGNTANIPIGNAVFTESKKAGVSDNIDLIVWKLDDTVSDDIAGQFEFYEPTDLSYDHQLTNKIQYLIVGFPNSRIDLKIELRKIIQEPFIYLTKSADEKWIKRLGLDPANNLLYRYDRKRTKGYEDKKVHTGPWTRGLSGCGIWFLPNLLAVEVSEIHPICVSIFIEYIKEHNIVVTTRLSTVRLLMDNLLKGKS